MISTLTQPGFAQALRVFRQAAHTVPAYAKFLCDRGIDADAVRTPADFAEVPPVTKDNYIRAYPPHELISGGAITGAGTWSSSSGSSGTPTFWARDELSHEHGVDLHARILRGFRAETAPTLVVVGFSMGDWIGGTYTFRSVADLHRRDLRVSVATPGMDIDLIRADIAALGPYYRQIVLAGYPPFVRDVLDRAPAAVLDQDIKVLMAGEAISEPWRDNLLSLLGKPDRPQDSCLIYGAADAGMFGHETASSIMIRRLAQHDSAFRDALFGADPVLPTFVEYDPAYRYVETDDRGHLLCTVANAMPLVRYRINDIGSVHTAAEVGEALLAAGHDPQVRTTTPTAGFIALRGRPDVAVSFYSVKFAPETVRAALTDPRLGGGLTGKFVLDKDLDATGGDRLRLLVELRADRTLDEAFGEAVGAVFVNTVAEASREYRDLRTRIGARAEPLVELRPFGSPEFRYAIKHDGRVSGA
ncbi:phenylacetate--CoA ligase family protein [Nocardia salmonicida]|uniref:phenylacetate--CoA ligase family protein n=1 Tax=Nocardia salmonicida TaxID=53431 RepID=UPI00379B24D3